MFRNVLLDLLVFYCPDFLGNIILNSLFLIAISLLHDERDLVEELFQYRLLSSFRKSQ